MDTPRTTPAAAPLRRPLPPTQEAGALADQLRNALEVKSGLRIHLKITDNRSTVMSVRYDQGGRVAKVGLHHMFLQVEPAMTEALAHWVRHPRSRRHAAFLNEFIRKHNHLIAPKRARRASLLPQGKVYDLRQMWDVVNARHFGGRVTAPITWGKMPHKARRRSIRFGSYMPGDHLIRIHPLLDDERVPEWFVRYIVFHEMLHADLGIEECDGRRVMHSKEFRAIERTYPDFAAAEAWMACSANLGALLGRARHKAHRGA
jgi:hypothetical protein